MKPESLKKLREYPEFKELVGFLAGELKKADSLDGLDKLDIIERGHEAGVRFGVKERLTALLEPLLSDVDKPNGTDTNEYAM